MVRKAVKTLYSGTDSPGGKVVGIAGRNASRGHTLTQSHIRSMMRGHELATSLPMSNYPLLPLYALVLGTDDIIDIN